MRNFVKNRIHTFISGLIIGAVEIIPGVSGGTMALILGIYERLIVSISKIDLIFIKNLVTGKLKQALIYSDFDFLLTLVLGMSIAVFSLASLIDYLMEYHPFLLKGFFTGLLLCSLFFKPLKLESLNFKILVGSFFAVLIFSLVFSFPSHAVAKEINLIYVFFGGFIAVCAFILPGISGSFLLLLLGLYERLISSIIELDFVFLVTLFLGCLSGLLLFIRFLKKAYDKFRETLTGFFYFLVLLSIPLIWKDGIWSISYPDPSVGNFEPVAGLFVGSMLILLLQNISFNARDT